MEIEIIEPSFKIETELNGLEILKTIERFGRVSHKSENKITADSAKEFMKRLSSWGHESVFEHFSFSVRFICDRGVTHELVRHRLASYTQESTRYCNYSSKIQFIRPVFFSENSELYQVWKKSCELAAQTYLDLISRGVTPEAARSVLPHSLKTEIVMTANLREWRHVFKMRCQKAAHPQIRQIMVPLLKEIQTQIPVLFDDFEIQEFDSAYPLIAVLKTSD